MHPIFTASLAMLAFAGNSLLCRLALRETAIDPASFTTVRILSGTIVLWLIIGIASRTQSAWQQRIQSGSLISAMALFVYAAAFSFAYVALPAGIGALLLFGAVQATMIGYALRNGERLSRQQTVGFLLAVCGLIGLLLPGISSPSVSAGLLMVAAGVAWGIYSLRGKASRDPIATTGSNFLFACPLAVALTAATFPNTSIDMSGVVVAAISGAITSALGYVIWYSAIPHLDSTTASVIQLSVPVLAAVGGILLLGEAITFSLILTATSIVLGILMVIFGRS